MVTPLLPSFMTFIMPVGVSNLGDVPQRNPGRKKLRPLAFFFTMKNTETGIFLAEISTEFSA